MLGGYGGGCGGGRGGDGGSEGRSTRYGGIKVGWKKIQRNTGHFLVLVNYISITLSYKSYKSIKFALKDLPFERNLVVVDQSV